jgi:hypothetical protein
MSGGEFEISEQLSKDLEKLFPTPTDKSSAPVKDDSETEPKPPTSSRA